VSHGIYPTSPREIINKGHKEVVTPQKCHLDGSPNIHVNIVNNLLSAINRGVEFHLGLLVDDAILIKLQFTGFSTVQ